MAVMIASWLAALQALLPPGRAFTRAPDAVLTKLLSAIAAILAAFNMKLDALLLEADPRRAGTMLPDWEGMLGLPDKCTLSGQSVFERQRFAYQRLVEQGGQSQAYFIELAALLGEPNVTISEYRQMHCNDHCNNALAGLNDVFTWVVNVPRQLQSIALATCNSHCNDFLRSYVANAIECPFNERKPANTTVLFAYLP
jgi:uncharacterized protein YmfQ (DUF2313 family)